MLRTTLRPRFGFAIAALASCAALTASAAPSPAAASPLQQAAKSTAHWRVVFRHHDGPASGYADYRVVVTAGKHDAWAFGGVEASTAAIAARWHGGHWRPVSLPRAVKGPIIAASVVSGSDIWAASQAGYVVHWNGRAWRVAKHFVSKGSILTGITATSRDDVWAFGASGFALGLGTWHLHNGRWTKISGIGGGIFSASAVSASDIWAISSSSPTGIAHYNGTAWRSASFPALTGFGASDLVTAGRGNLWVLAFKHHKAWVLHLQGTTWSKFAGPAAPSVTPGIAADGRGGLWALGETSATDKSAILHMNAQGRWSSQLIGTEGTAVFQVAHRPGTSSAWGAGLLVQKLGAAAAIWSFGPTG